MPQLLFSPTHIEKPVLVLSLGFDPSLWVGMFRFLTSADFFCALFDAVQPHCLPTFVDVVPVGNFGGHDALSPNTQVFCPHGKKFAAEFLVHGH